MILFTVWYDMPLFRLVLRDKPVILPVPLPPLLQFTGQSINQPIYQSNRWKVEVKTEEGSSGWSKVRETRTLERRYLSIDFCGYSSIDKKRALEMSPTVSLSIFCPNNTCNVTVLQQFKMINDENSNFELIRSATCGHTCTPLIPLLQTKFCYLIREIMILKVYLCYLNLNYGTR